ncbi:MAG TPA: helix-turn-helix domain-containing protein, partial [Puia sp.]|nr:helix-turn-helix domain-containing protein [Puia sp.]
LLNMAKTNCRSAIIELYLSKMRQADIAKALKISRQFVSKTISRYNELGNDEDRPRAGRPRTANTPRIRKTLKTKIKRNPRRSMRKMAQDLGISDERVRHIVKKQLGLRPYKYQKAHYLNERMEKIRLERCRRLLPRIRQNQQVYEEQILKPLRDEWMNALYPDGDMCFQQDSAPAHRAKKSQTFCREHFPDFIAANDWPSNSPDLNPLDYSIWSILKQKVCAKRHRSIDSLKATLEEAWNEISEETLCAVIDQFPKRVRACIAVKGKHFEIV